MNTILYTMLIASAMPKNLVLYFYRLPGQSYIQKKRGISSSIRSSFVEEIQLK